MRWIKSSDTEAATSGNRVDDPPAVDLATQLEDLVNAVWQAEENWRFDDRLEISVHSLPSKRRS